LLQRNIDSKSSLLTFTEETKMYEDFMKMAQESMKPMMKMAENNTAFQAEIATEMMQSNLTHVQALAEVKDMNVAVEMQQKYVEALNEKLMAVAKENTAVIEAAVTEAGKIFEGSLAEVQAQAKKTAQNIEKEIAKAGKKAA
jgi:predicted transcriptional regulator